ncbi:kelch-like protein 28 isoform X2 [Artemia franciscana]|uniref:BTB domain-containing protein n=2 Tax=Artemia franciscana TaxID=6661 RepID=A0AA88H2K5_ARTSF|nr:hypothetical protein QYM36_018401 [Artemia franciscana]
MLVGDCLNTLSCVFSKLNEDRKSFKFCDVILKTGLKSFPAHKVVLSASSAYFSAMFGGNFQEKDKKEIIIKEEAEDVIEAMLEYCYTRQIDMNHPSMLKLIRCFDKFAIDSAIKLLDKNLSNIINTENCVNYLEVSIQFSGFRELKRASAVSFLQMNDSFITNYLKSTHVDILLELLKHEEFYSSNSAVASLFEWIKHETVFSILLKEISCPHLLTEDASQILEICHPSLRSLIKKGVKKENIYFDYKFLADGFDFTLVESLRMESLPGYFSRKFELGNNFILQFYKNHEGNFPQHNIAGLKIWPEENCLALGTYDVEILMTESPLNPDGRNYRFTCRWSFCLSNSHPLVFYFDFDDSLKYRIRVVMSKVQND